MEHCRIIEVNFFSYPDELLGIKNYISLYQTVVVMDFDMQVRISFQKKVTDLIIYIQ